MNTGVDVDGAAVLRGLRDVTRSVQADVVDEMSDFGTRKVLPTAKNLAPRIVSRTLVVKAAKTNVYLTTLARGKQRRIVGVTNFGGTITTPLVPRNAQALRLANGAIVAKVTGPRVLRGQRYLDRAVEQHARGMAQHLQTALPRAMQRRITGIT